MALSRRPARFNSRPDSMSTRAISEEQFESLRAAASIVYKNEQDLVEEKSPEVNKPDAKAGSANVKGKAKASFEKGMPSANVINGEEEETFENGIELLASVAAKFEAEENKMKN